MSVNVVNCVQDSNYIRFCFMHNYTEPSIIVTSINNTVLSGQNVTFGCIPFDDDIELYWTYQIVNTDGTVTSTNISQSKYLTNLSLLHHLTLPIATVSDTGFYTCIVRGSCTTISQTISLTVLPGN